MSVAQADNRPWAARWIAAFVVGTVLFALLPAFAQSVGPAQPDPPALVGRIARIYGIATTRTAGEDRWRLARLNQPLTRGDTVWAEPGGQAAIDVAASRVGLDGGTEFRLDALDDGMLEASLIQGEAHVRLLHLPPGMQVLIHTPRATVSLQVDGRYAIATGDSLRPDMVTVLEGAARLDVAGAATTLSANQAATISGASPYSVGTGPARINSFAVRMMAQEPRLATETPELARWMTGIGDLTQYGVWQQTTEYGPVWLPRVETGWVPYRNGVWAWVEPWGWTWIDDAPWGFAPFHYGRWVERDQGWSWVPATLHAGAGFRPAYAPALAGFLGVRPAPGQPALPPHGPMGVIGWVPLGPAEAYRPGFPASPAFVHRLNVSQVRNPDAIGGSDDATPANIAAATFVPVWTMRASRPAQLARTRLPPVPVENLAPLAANSLPGPDLTTWGMTPALARHLGLLRPAGRPSLLRAFPTLRPAGAASLRLPGAAPGPELTPSFPGLRNAPGPAGRNTP